MTTYLGLYELINAFCGLVLLTLILHSRVGMGLTATRRRYMRAAILLVIFYASDSLWYAMDCGVLPQNRTVSMLLKSIYFVSSSAAGYSWFIYMETLTGAGFTRSRKRIFFSGALVWVHLVLTVINWFTGILFWEDEALQYSRGPFFGLQYLVVYAYLATAAFHALYKANHNYIDRSRYIVIATFPIIPAISALLQLFYWRIPFNCMAFTLSVLIMYMNELGDQVSREPLTGLANRKHFMHALEEGMDAHENDGQLYLFMIDMNRFKRINDTFGHVEGDKAILMTVEALREACSEMHRKIVLSRYGGDEFVIIAELEREEEAKELKEKICSKIEDRNTGILLSYRLSLSIGCARYTPEYKGIRSFIAAADKELYIEKEKAHAAMDAQI
ncbi:MAG: diguanylate cyclase [Lachnospiraceae bacterium]|nr:diguanylate cyclase [Lachnospiraceae bacterium]